jgi:hypothetical protein
VSPVSRLKISLEKTALDHSPFMILEATTRCNRRRIVELAEEKSLELDHDICQKARSDLTNTRARLSKEMGWLPGVSPGKAFQLVEGLHHDPMTVRGEAGLPTLAHLNLLAAILEAVNFAHDAEDLAGCIQEVAYLAEDLNAEEVMKYLNEDRTVSGFPELRQLDQIEAELSERKRYYRSAIKGALDRLPTITLVTIITKTVEEVTAGGEDHAPALIDDLVDSYEVEAQEFLQKEAENAHNLIKAIRDLANSGEEAVKPFVAKLESVARNWDMVAQPIQLSTKARGIDHEASLELAYEIRGLAIELFNHYNMLTQSQRLTNLLQELFSEVPDVFERIEQDADALENIFYEREKAEAQRGEWERDITYSAEIGLVLKERLSISSKGISWKGKSFPIDSITRVRWGGVRNSVNGIPMGATYTIAFGDSRSEVVVVLKNKDIYATFIEKLWRAVCVRLMGDMLDALRDGQDLQFGDALVHDDGVTLVRRKSFGANENVRCSWGQVEVWGAEGSFYIASNVDKKVNSGISYIDISNTHILEQIIRMAFKKPDMRRLSDLLR